MICPKCQKDVESKDFYGKDKCYKCITLERLKTVKAVKRVCKLCKNDLPTNRWRYCSDKCLEIASLKRRREYKKKLYICVNRYGWKDCNFNLGMPKKEDFDNNLEYM